MGAFNCLLFDGRLLAGLGGAVRPLDPLDVPLASRGVRHMGCLIIVISWSSPRFVDAGLDPFRKPAVCPRRQAAGPEFGVSLTRETNRAFLHRPVAPGLVLYPPPRGDRGQAYAGFTRRAPDPCTAPSPLYTSLREGAGDAAVWLVARR